MEHGVVRAPLPRHTCCALLLLGLLLTVQLEQPGSCSLDADPHRHLPAAHQPGSGSNVSFWWGVATASYQIEGAYKDGGRGWSIWDQYSHTPGKVANGDTGDVADDFFHRYPEDIALMRHLGIQHFRLSISWPRIFPDGRGEHPNQAGLDFYGKVVEALLAAGIEPYVTLYHWDLPQPLQAEYGGWVSERIVEDFAAYAGAVVGALGPRVTHWSTFNEPLTFCFQGYGDGIHAPGRCSDRSRCAEGDSATEPWLCSHHVLLAHAAAVARIRAVAPHARVTMNLNSEWAVPFSESGADQEAAARHLDFQLGLYADPVYFGDYPASVRARVAALPPFSDAQRAALAGSLDYFALNHYTTKWVGDARGRPEAPEGTFVTGEREGRAIGPRAASPWLYCVPWGFRALLAHVARRYQPAQLLVTENGVDVPGEDDLAPPQVLHDAFREEYYRTYLAEAVRAVHEDGVPLVGYFAWSLLDNFEWADGYSKRFGIVHVDYKNNQQRTVKASAHWLAHFFGTRGSHAPEGPERHAGHDQEHHRRSSRQNGAAEGDAVT